MENKTTNNITKCILSILFAFIVTILMKSYIIILENNLFVSNIQKDAFLNTIIYFHFKKYLFFAILLSLAIYFLEANNHLKKLFFKYRFFIAIIIFLVLVFFQIHGSSIDIWSTYFSNKTSPIFGIPRTIRSDEWNVLTPFSLSQYENLKGTFPYYSNTIRGCKTDAFILYGAPVRDIAIIFHPFQIGYLFLNKGQGLSFFWMGRLITLLLVSFEFGRLITEDDCKLSIGYSLLIAFSPIVQWWFAINGLVEMLIFGQLVVIIFNEYISKKDNLTQVKRYTLPFCFFWAMGCYMFTVYPAWEIPLAYVFLIMLIWTVRKNMNKVKKLSFSKIDILIILLSVIFCCGIIYHIFKRSFQTIYAVMHTAYPGARFESSKGEIRFLFQYPASIFYPLIQKNLSPNVCENAFFYDLFPLGIILSIWNFIHDEKKDFLSIMLLALNGGFLSRYLFGWPKWLSKITLLYMVQSNRLYLAIGLINLFLLFRNIALMQQNLSDSVKYKAIKVLIAILSTFAVIIYCNKINNCYMSLKMTIVSAAFLLSFSLSILLYKKNKFSSKIFLVFCLVIAFLCGGLVNPVTRGVYAIENQSLYRAIRLSNTVDDVWIVDNANELDDYAIMAGASTINSTNVYPNLSRWKKLDPTLKYKHIYNRYAHIYATITDQKKTKFTLVYGDAFHLDLAVRDMKKLKITKILTNRELTSFSNSKVKFINIYNKNGYQIYQIKYK